MLGALTYVSTLYKSANTDTSQHLTYVGRFSTYVAGYYSSCDIGRYV